MTTTTNLHRYTCIQRLNVGSMDAFSRLRWGGP
jgi:hypothetical protein